jgi:hypothetical protein
VRIRKALQVSLRTVFIALTLACILLAVEAKQARDQKQAVTAILGAGGRVHFDDQLKPSDLQPTQAGKLRQWLIDNLGPEYFARVSLVTLYPNANFNADDQVKMLAGIPDLQNLAIWPGGSTRSTMLDNGAPGGLTDEGVCYIVKSLPRLRHLSLTAAPLTPRALTCLEQLDGLKSLQIGRLHSCDEATVAEFRRQNPQIDFH